MISLWKESPLHDLLLRLFPCSDGVPLNLCYLFSKGNFRMTFSLFKVPQPDSNRSLSVLNLLKQRAFSKIPCVIYSVSQNYQMLPLLLFTINSQSF
jgi:hypothetical protein